jgi:hypothetical protein
MSGAITRAAGAIPLVLILGTSVAAGPITFLTALPVSKGDAILRGQAEVVRATDDPSPMDRELTVLAAPTALAYGATRRLALFAVVPFVDKSLDVDTPAGRVERGKSGLGDSLFFGRYTLLQVDRPGETIRLAPFGGLKVPTGDHRERDRLGRLPRPLQLGTGSWDPLFGTAFTWQTLAWEFDADAAYLVRTTADRFRFGDVAQADASFQYRLWPRRLGPGVPAFLYGVLETNLVWQGKDRMGDVVDQDSGGVTWFLDPGIQFVTRRWILEAAVQLPAVQELNGEALGMDYRVIAGFRWWFSVPL